MLSCEVTPGKVLCTAVVMKGAVCVKCGPRVRCYNPVNTGFKGADADTDIRELKIENIDVSVFFSSFLCRGILGVE